MLKLKAFLSKSNYSFKGSGDFEDNLSLWGLLFEDDYLLEFSGGNGSLNGGTTIEPIWVDLLRLSNSIFASSSSTISISTFYSSYVPSSKFGIPP